MNRKIEKVMQLNNKFHMKIQDIQPCGLKFKKVDLEEIYGILHSFQRKSPILKKRDMKLVDLGCWSGIISLLINETRGEFNGRVYAIDWFTRKDDPKLNEVARYINIKHILEDNLRYYGALETITIIDETSKVASTMFNIEEIDVLFINYSHKYQDVVNDLNYWYDRIKPGGLIIGHGCETLDIDKFDNLNVEVDNPFRINLGLIKAIKERLPNVAKTDVGNIWYSIKPEKKEPERKDNEKTNGSGDSQ